MVPFTQHNKSKEFLAPMNSCEGVGVGEVKLKTPIHDAKEETKAILGYALNLLNLMWI